MESPSHDSVLRPPRPAAGALRLSSSFKPLSEAARASGATTPTGILLGKASDIIISGIERGFDEECTTPHSVGLANSTGRKLRSCLSLGRHSDSPVPPASTAATYSAEPKGLHWKPELVAVSAADQSFKSHDLQARCMKLEAELQESEAARALLQKQLHRVQDAMKQNRTNLEDAQRVALAAEAKTAAAEAKAASLTREVRQLHADPAESNTQVHHAAYKNACSEPSSRESWTLPEVQAALALQEPPCTSAAGLPRTLTAASHGQTETLAWNCQLPHWSECLHLAQQKVAIHGGQQPWIARVDKQRAGITSITTGLSATGQLPDSTARHQAQENTAGLSMVCQVPGSIAGQLATGQVPGSSPQPLPGCAKQHHTAAAQTQSVAALQRIANTVPSWAETTLPDHPGSPHFQGFLASAVMLETLGRQKRMEALSLHASSTQEKGAMEPKKNETHGQGSRQGPASPGSKHEVNPGQGQGGSSPESSISHKYLWLLQNLTACSQE